MITLHRLNEDDHTTQIIGGTVIEDDSYDDVSYNKTLSHKAYLLLLLLPPQSKSRSAKTLPTREHQGDPI